ncbi:MAG: colanic acid biosynthesis acetyltransferase WcaF [Bacteroidetes bacterium]|nr:colanic acid biosynthesis acetyltransferase WcaF [Bacteroidota bacterium]
MNQTDLSKYDNSWYSPKSGIFSRALWYLVNVIFFRSPLLHSNTLKIGFLQAFGARIGKEVVIKPAINIKYPWLLEIGNNSWIGENVWIDNLVKVKIGSNVCISQGAMLLTGNHDYSKVTFDLLLGEIELEDGVWIGAKAIVGPGVNCRSHAVLAVNSVATSELEAYSIYQGNPAIKQKDRNIE